VGIGPGNLDPSFQIQFPTIAQILSATFTATLSADLFQLTDGRSFQAGSTTLSATLTDPTAGRLLPGDFAVLTVEANEVSPVPEPASVVLLASGLAACAMRRRRKPRVS
jgi:hypothetical protein